ncbi:MAG: methyl-accepting chemotaxis protein [Aquabacterium sp.]|uniref:methyl-accepting chemotaxis protein n=1 Tax=Aquabacterium sp. TaxID=1872578 RepID=UPI003BD350AC
MSTSSRSRSDFCVRVFPVCEGLRINMGKAASVCGSFTDKPCIVCVQGGDLKVGAGMVMWLRQFSFLRRLQALAVFNIAAVMLCVAAGVYSASQLTRIGEDVGLSKDAVADILPPPMYLIEMRLVLSQLVEGSISVSIGKSEVARLAKEYDDRVLYWQQKEGVPPPVKARLMGAQHDAAKAFIAKARLISEQAEHMGSEDLRMMVPEINALYLAQRHEVDETVKVASGVAEASMSDFVSVIRLSKVILAVVLVVSIVLSVVLFSTTIRSILRPLRQSVSAVDRMAQGDLTEDIQPEGRDEMTVLSSALLRLQQSLKQTVQVVQGNAMVVAESSRGMAQQNQDLSDRTHQQAESLQQTSTTLGALSHAVGDNAYHSAQASELATGASEAAARSGAVMGQVVDSIRDIQASSRQIGEIIGLIDSIAFQTNILALNAAVEAARAGEQGRGFAVVASEVRMLAHRSAEAAREIKQLVTTSGEQVERGTLLVDEAGVAMRETVEAIVNVARIVQDITVSTQHQTEGVGQVEGSLAQIDHHTQQNAALVHDLVGTAAQLREQAQSLLDAISAFRV